MNYFLGDDCIVQENVVLGLIYSDNANECIVGSNATIRYGTIIYGDVVIGDNFKTGHSVLIRENTRIGNYVVVGTNTVIDGNVQIGNYVKLESNVYIPTHTKIGNYVFLGPSATLTNDKYPQRLRETYQPSGPVIEDSVTIGANATILPGIRIGEGAMVAAGSVVTKDIPSWSLAVGTPAKIHDLPENLRTRNQAINW